MRGFGSDNHSGVHPQIMAALTQVNVDHEPSYGTDSVSEKAIQLFRQHFGSQAEVFFVFNGTGSNISALKAMTQSYNSVLCSDVSHMNVDEVGGPETSACKLIPLKSTLGKISIEEAKKHCIRRGDQHFAQVKAISLTQPTELGTCYSLEEIKAFCDWAHSEGLLVHMDGARIANAVTRLNTSFKEMTTDLGVDVVSFGGTKNGLMMGEAVVFLKPELAQNFKYIRKQLTQLPSKTRFISAQFIAYFENDLWKKIAQHSLQKAQELEALVKDIPSVKITAPVESNVVFATIPAKWVKELRKQFFFYVWDESTFECRWMTSWDTHTNDITGFAEALKQLSHRAE